MRRADAARLIAKISLAQESISADFGSCSGDAGSHTLQLTNKGQYQALFAASAIGQNIPPGTYTISGTGRKDVGAFSATVTIGCHLAISNKSSLAAVSQTHFTVWMWSIRTLSARSGWSEAASRVLIRM